MKYWWVNQNQTYNQEINGGYMWSPKHNSNGAQNHYYNNMKEVEPGDVVFSYRKKLISDIGIVQQRAISASKPHNFGTTGGYWGDDGWLISVKWEKLDRAIQPKLHFDAIKPTLPAKYSPLNKKTGYGLQAIYLAAVPDPMAQVLLKVLGVKSNDIIRKVKSLGSDDDEAIENIEDQIQQSIENDTNIDSTEKKALVNARRGQGKYRQNLGAIETGCRISGITDKRLLRASHIKPWRCCKNNHERLDGNNGLLLSPNIDHLFDRGYITFCDDGKVIISNRISPDQLKRMGITVDESLSVGTFNDLQKPYLHYHRENVFLG
jgi:hypothetical protein